MDSRRSESMSTGSNSDTKYCITLVNFFMMVAIIAAGIIFHYHHELQYELQTVLCTDKKVEALKEEITSLKMDKQETEFRKIQCTDEKIETLKEEITSLKMGKQETEFLKIQCTDEKIEALKEEINSLRLEKQETELRCKQTVKKVETERFDEKQKLWVEFQSYLEQQRDYVKKPLLEVMWRAAAHGQFGDLVWLLDCFTKDDVRGYFTRLLDFLKGVSRESQCMQELKLRQLKTENINKGKLM